MDWSHSDLPIFFIFKYQEGGFKNNLQNEFFLFKLSTLKPYRKLRSLFVYVHFHFHFVIQPCLICSVEAHRKVSSCQKNIVLEPVKRNIFFNLFFRKRQNTEVFSFSSDLTEKKL